LARILQEWQGEISAHSREPPASGPIPERDALDGQDSIELPHRYVMFGGDAASIEIWLPQMHLDVLHDPDGPSGLERVLSQIGRVEMSRDNGPKQINCRLIDHFAAGRSNAPGRAANRRK
jgi:hypothetical protein